MSKIVKREMFDEDMDNIVLECGHGLIAHTIPNPMVIAAGFPDASVPKDAIEISCPVCECNPSELYNPHPVLKCS